MTSSKKIRVCIFCGKPPVEKTNEHAMSDWLAEYTGNPKRNVNVGVNQLTSKIHHFAVDQMKAPACNTCNNRYSFLEGAAKKVISQIEKRSSITSKEAETLLEWFDKIRICVWLYFNMLNNDPHIDPHFHADQRISAKDRFLLVYPCADVKGLNWSGFEFPIFNWMPSCCGLRINNTFYISASSDYLLSKNFAFPYPKKIEWTQESLELSDFRINQKAKEFFLPINPFKFSMGFGQIIHSPKLYNLSPEFYSTVSEKINITDRYIASKVFMFDQYAQVSTVTDNASRINFGNIIGSECVPIWKIINQIPILQDRIFTKSGFPEHTSDMRKLHSIYHKSYLKAIHRNAP